MRLPTTTLAFLLVTLVQAQTPTYQGPTKPIDVRIDAYITVLGAQSLAQADQMNQSARLERFAALSTGSPSRSKTILTLRTSGPQRAIWSTTTAF